jgi:hypothetical protein
MIRPRFVECCAKDNVDGKAEIRFPEDGDIVEVKKRRQGTNFNDQRYSVTRTFNIWPATPPIFLPLTA